MSGEEPAGNEPRAAIERGTGERFLIVLGCAFIVLYGLRAAQVFVVPVLLATLLSMACVPPVRMLEKSKLPTALAVTIVLVFAGSLLVVTAVYVGSALASFQQSHEFQGFSKNLEQTFGINVDLDSLFPADNVGEIVTAIAGTALSGVSSVAIVLLLMFFMLVEFEGLPVKLRRAFRLPDDNLGSYRTVASKVHDYVALKTAVSILTGALVVLLCTITGLRYAPLWGLIAFLFNYVPNIGSIIAAIPVVMLALIQKDPAAVPNVADAEASKIAFDYTRAAWVAGGFLAINTVVGNVIEPRLMGRRLGLSPLVVFVSLLLWNFVLGPVGMLVAIPLTVAVKIMLEHSDDLSWLAVLLGPNENSASDEGTQSDPPSAPV